MRKSSYALICFLLSFLLLVSCGEKEVITDQSDEEEATETDQIIEEATNVDDVDEEIVVDDTEDDYGDII